MFNLKRLGVVAAVAATTMATGALAAPLQFSTSFGITANAPPFQAGPLTPMDIGGLDGASATLDFLFADGTIFDGNNFASAQSASLTVMGASVASSNGTFGINGNVGLSASGQNGVGELFSNPIFGFSNLNALEVAGVFEELRFNAGGSVVPGAGNALTLDVLNAISFSFDGISQLGNFDDLQFTATNFQTTASEVGLSPVPLPAGLPLLLGGLAGFGFLGKRRRKKMAAQTGVPA